ncbi:deoxynucleoside triphosphate triphosphohydrolase SAMHD1-like [Symsagittifera roscoffensis]|uniref:deoxynucleoside triphosphate triphosphohydrolase SAMHD1-like n=1 Tax=Symsagittifera roscoffensis TaxID=84072 RepID=UPI00307C586F
MPFKTFNDPIYGPIGLDLKLVKLIDTVQFQRLHYLRQLGVAYSVYPGASHTRFEHSIGTCHLAGELLESLLKVAKENEQVKRTETDETIAIENESITDERERLIKVESPIGIEVQSNERESPIENHDPDSTDACSIVDILSNDKDLLCVKMAALLHDLGHGPFSHFWEILIKAHIEILNENSTKPEILNENSTKHEIKEFVHEEMTPEILNENSTKHEIKEFVHEEMTIKFIEMMLKEGSTIRKELDLNEDDLEFIKELIDSEEKTRISERSKDDKKNFFYEIVSNKKTGIDVDKWDYICRDSHHVGINTSFESKRLLKLCKVVTDSDNKTHIAWPQREFDNVLQMFEQRKRLHKKVYQHRVIKPIERLYIELFRTANEFLKVPSSVYPDVSLPILEAHKDPYTFVNMTDGLLQAINLFNHSKAEDCKRILLQIQLRDIGKIVCEANVDELSSYNKSYLQDLKKKFNSYLELKSMNLQGDQILRKDELDIQFYRTVLDFGMKGQDNPMNYVWLYSKDQNSQTEMAKNLDWDWDKMTPKKINENSVFLSANCATVEQKKTSGRIVCGFLF